MDNTINNLRNIEEQMDSIGYVVLQTSVKEQWILELLKQHFGSNVADSYWKDLFEVRFEPNSYVPTDSIVNSDQELYLHTDGTFEPTPPRSFALQCVQNDIDGYGDTLLVDGWSIVDQLSLTSRTILEESVFQFRRPESNQVLLEAHVLEVIDGKYRLRFRNDKKYILRPPSEEAKVALSEFERLARSLQNRISVSLMPGDILLVDNWRFLHGRTALSGRQTRFLRRAWL